MDLVLLGTLDDVSARSGPHGGERRVLVVEHGEHQHRHVRRHPADNSRFWRGLSVRPYLDRITEPVLLVHGRFDESCPPPWATATQRAMRSAGVDSTLRWYDDAHAFGPAFLRAMADTVSFLRAAGVR